MQKHTFFTLSFFLFCAAVLALGLRGLPGNPTAEEMNSPEWKENGPFELSPDRGRFALLYSLAEDRSLHFSLPVARFAAPDLGLAPGGAYASLFAPGVSFLLLPGYEIGKYFHASQMGAVMTVAFFALLNGALVRAIALRLGAHPFAANLAVLSFLFATPAFAYAVSLYQHHFSVFLIFSSLYALLRFEGWRPAAYVWFAYALGVAVDNPNAILMAPVALYAAGRLFELRKKKRGTELGVRIYRVTTLLAAAGPLLFFFWFNQAANGAPFRLSGTLPQVRIVDASGGAATVDHSQDADPEASVPVSAENGQGAAAFFQSRNLLNGFYTHLISPDRGTLWYAPLMLSGFFGLAMLYAFHTSAANVLAGIVGTNLVLYSMWGDPYGGWAFGSRYLIPAYAALSVGLGLVLTRFRTNVLAILVFMLLFGYSAWVNTLGAVTTNMNPPQVEVLELERLYGKEQKYTYARNWQYLNEQGSKSFVFRVFAGRFMDAVSYQQWLVGWLWAAMLWYAVRLYFGLESFSRSKVEASRS
jgi:hypothetical protein